MKILHRYLLSQLTTHFLLSLSVFVTLFTVFDFFDKIDNVVNEGASLLVALEYFLLKLPLIVSLMIPVGMLVSTLFTIGLLSKNSEITAMRASGLRIQWIVLPAFCVGLFLSGIGILLNETVVPYTQRRVRELYNIDIRQKDKRGGYSQTDFWWRDKQTFYSVSNFDSRDATLYGLTSLVLDDNFKVVERTDAYETSYVDPILGWTMKGVTRYRFFNPTEPEMSELSQLPLPLKENPEDFYETTADPSAMSYKQLKQFIVTQSRNGLPVAGYFADLYGKIAFPFVSAVIPIIVIPFALIPARKGTMAPSIIASLLIGFSYYAVHSFSVAMGRAEILPPLVAAWAANLLLAAIGMILLSGTEAPS